MNAEAIACRASNRNQLLFDAESLLRSRDLSSALLAFDLAETSGAEADRCAAGRWQAYMLAGDFESAWLESDEIRRRGAPDPNRFWQGEDIIGKEVIVRCLHGLGDAVQFLRYAPLLRAHTVKCIFETPPALFELAPCFTGVDEVSTWGEQAPKFPPAWDSQIEIVELPYLFRTTISQLPLATRYLQLASHIMEEAALHAKSPSNLRVGVVWASGNWNPSRSVPLARIATLLRTNGCEFWNLQGGPARDQWSLLKSYGELHEAQSCAQSVLHLAALIAQMDLIITPDTLAAHLAGALGVPAWVMLERTADWRWMRDRNDTPWYPTLRLFRQEREGDWCGAVEQVRRALELEVRSRV
jgi:hypothetical protein